MGSVIAVLLAAGAGTRMKSEKAKVVHKISGKPMVNWVLDAIAETGIEETIVVTGHQEEQVKACITANVSFVSQTRQLGTGHAVMEAAPLLEGKKGLCMVLCGDTPMITAETLKKVIGDHQSNQNSITVLTAVFDDPTGYGRIVRNAHGTVQGIVEHRDCNSEQRKIKEINTGLYCFDIEWLLKSLKEIKNQNDQQEYYLTDTLSIILASGGKAGTTTLDCNDEMMGINDRVQLAAAQKILNHRIIGKHMRNGVTFLNPETCMVEDTVEIGRDTVIYPGTILQGKTILAGNCVIGPYTTLTNVKAGCNVTIINSVADGMNINDNTTVGPFVYLHP